MKDEAMSTLGFFREQLTEADASRRLIFATIEGPIGAGYHVTELKLADVSSIDCGANQTAWTEATLQLLDGYGEDHMTAGTFAGIADKSMTALPGLRDAPLSVEFAPKNEGLRIYQIGAIQRTDDTLIVGLQNRQALCKPSAAQVSGGADCCSPKASACC